jgi:hypothetical protein
MPDLGLFTPDQWRPAANAPRSKQAPSRGAIEAKPPSQDIDQLIRSPQVRKYLEDFGLVLATNLREFRLLRAGTADEPDVVESYSLASSETDFWNKVEHPRKTASVSGAQLVEALRRMLSHRAAITKPETLAWLLASYAQEALSRLNAADPSILAPIRADLEEALGVTFEGKEGDEFFQSSFVQSLFYGLFSAWVLWCKDKSAPATAARFTWKGAAWTMRVPLVQPVFEAIAVPSKLGPLGIVEILDWAEDGLDRVDRVEFFKIFDEGRAVQFFYEPFLEAFDPKLRKDLGVWYTPSEVVRYMVARADAALRSELGITDGLASPNVFVLDPCCGTGSYLIEVLERIHSTLVTQKKLGDAIAASTVKQAALTRVFGFEVLTAPFVVSHLQLGLFLLRLGAPLSESGSERAAVYLTNSLTGWSPPSGPQRKLSGYIAGLEEERTAATEVKTKAPILVILGNPPYNAFAGVSPKVEDGLGDAYKEGLQRRFGIKKFNLDDLYVRFFHLANRRIVENTGRGLVSFISNFSYIADPSFVVMRERFIADFDVIQIDNLNGDSRGTGKRTPAGTPDPSIFSTDANREGIRVGTAICLLVRKKEHSPAASVDYREFWGENKRADLSVALANPASRPYSKAIPLEGHKFSFQPPGGKEAYLSWPGVTDLSSERPSQGLMEKRQGALVDINRSSLETRLRSYFDRSASWESIASAVGGLGADAARFKAKEARAKALKSETFDESRLLPYLVRPFDLQWCYYTPVRPVWNEPRPVLYEQFRRGTSFLISRPIGGGMVPEGPPFLFTSSLGDDHVIQVDACFVPLLLHPTAHKIGNRKSAAHAAEQAELASHADISIANLSAKARKYLSLIGVDGDEPTLAGLVWNHVLAIGYSPLYRSENAGPVKLGFPRVPLPATADLLKASALVGEQVAHLVDASLEVDGVTDGTIRPELGEIGVARTTDGKSIDPNAGDLEVRAPWGSRNRVVMPGKGKTASRDYTQTELDSFCPPGTSDDARFKTIECLGATTVDVYLNDRTYIANVPSSVWSFVIGGYPVLKKWLSYRQFDVLGRSLHPHEAVHFTNMTRRLTTLVMLSPSLNRNYQEVESSAFDFSGL